MAATLGEFGFTAVSRPTKSDPLGFGLAGFLVSAYHHRCSSGFVAVSWRAFFVVSSSRQFSMHPGIETRNKEEASWRL
jgi:hypothetical protein